MFSENLKIARKRKDYTLEQLANEYNKRFGGGLSKGTLSKYENGKQEPMITVVINLAEIYSNTECYSTMSHGHGSLSHSSLLKPFKVSGPYCFSNSALTASYLLL